MAGIGLAVALLIMLVIIYLIFGLVAYATGREDQRYGYDNNYWLILSWLYDAGYTSTWRRKDIKQRNAERFEDREKQNGRIK